MLMCASSVQVDETCVNAAHVGLLQSVGLALQVLAAATSHVLSNPAPPPPPPPRQGGQGSRGARDGRGGRFADFNTHSAVGELRRLEKQVR